MDNDGASKFINSIIKNLQLLCHSDVHFNDNIEIIGHLYLNVDSNSKYNYFVNEKVCKNDESSTVFVSNSFHAEPVKKNEVSDKQGGTVNTDMKPNKLFEGRLKRNERSNHSVLQKTFSDNNLCPTKRSRTDLPIMNQFQENSELGDKNSRITQNQFNTTHNSPSLSSRNGVSLQSDSETDQNDYQNEDSYTNLSYSYPQDIDKQNSQKCTIDLTMVKCEPETDEEMEYIKGQQKILEQSRDQSYTDSKNLSTYSSSSNDIKMYSSAVHIDDTQNTSHSLSIDYSGSGFSENSPVGNKSTFPNMLPHSVQSPSCGSQEGGMNVEMTPSYKVIYDDNGCIRYACAKCRAILSTKGSFMRHFNEKHLNLGFICTFCGHKFTQRTSLRRHLTNLHEVKDVLQNT